MSAMLASRVDLMDALGLASRGVRISGRKAMLDQAVADVRGGAPLSAALEKRNALTPAGYNLVRVGEQSGSSRDAACPRRALRGEQHRRMKRFLALIEPACVLLIAVFSVSS